MVLLIKRKLSGTVNIKVYFRARNKEGYFIVIKKLIHQKDITILISMYLLKEPQNTKCTTDRTKRRHVQILVIFGD